MITNVQICGARGLLRMNLKKASEAIEVAPNTLAKVEIGGSVTRHVMASIISGYEMLGVEFGEQGWVRLKDN